MHLTSPTNDSSTPEHVQRRPVVVALDGSDKDDRGIAVGSAIAELSDGDLHVVRVISGGNPTMPPAAPGLYDPAAERRAAETHLAKVIETIRTPAGRKVTTAVLESSDVAAALSSYAGDHDAVAMVLATRAAGARGRAVAGSVADTVMRDCPRPVVLVPPGAGFLAGKTPSFSRVLVPLEDSSLAFRSLEFIIALPHASSLEYVLVEVISEERARATAERRLATTATWLRSRGAKSVEVRAVLAPDVAEAIVIGVREVMADVIAMSTRGAGGMTRLLVGSVAEGVVRRSEVPVMLLTPRVLAGQFEAFDARLRAAGDATE
jgi:nucleotide-binding universal stress UspA family protein